MDFSELTKQLTSDLDVAFRHLPPEKAIDCIERIEARISVGLAAAIIRVLRRLDPRIIGIENNKFTLEGGAFEVFVGYEDVWHPNTVAVLVIQIGLPATQPPKGVPIGGTGKYNEAQISTSPQLQRYSDVIAELTQKFYQQGYAWLAQFLLLKVRELESSVTIDLYAALRVAFGEKRTLADRCLLILIDGNNGNYVFDLHSAEQTIKRISTQRGVIQRTTSEMFLGLLGSFLQFKQMFSRHVIASGEKFQVDFTQTEYSDKTLFALSERVLFKSEAGGSKTGTLFPLARDDPPFLVVAFPTVRESEILPVLRRHAKELQETLKKQRNRVRTLHDSHKSSLSSLSFGQVGQVIGGFTRGILGL
jgi:hypothetical protein